MCKVSGVTCLDTKAHKIEVVSQENMPILGVQPIVQTSAEIKVDVPKGLKEVKKDLSSKQVGFWIEPYYPRQKGDDMSEKHSIFGAQCSLDPPRSNVVDASEEVLIVIRPTLERVLAG